MGRRAASSIVIETNSSRSISSFSSTSTSVTGKLPTFMPSIDSAASRASSGESAIFTPPIAARPVVHAWILTTTGPPRSAAMERASPAERATPCRGTASPRSRRAAFP